MHARQSNWLQVAALACCGATVHAMSAADGCRTTTFSKHFSADPACHESPCEASALWHQQIEQANGHVLHHAIRHCVSNLCRKAGLNSEEAGAILELHEKAHDGTVKEARMDVVVSRLGGLERWMIDLSSVDGKCATAVALGGTEGALRSAEQEKQRRYKGHAHALSVELRGRITRHRTEPSRTIVAGSSDCESV